MSPGMVFDHPGLCPPGTVATRHDHVRRKHFAAEFVYFVVMIHDDNDRYRGPAAEHGIRTTFFFRNTVPKILSKHRCITCP